jgi:hypothetical protein
MNNTKQSMAKSGNLNPMYGKRHSTDTKKKISDSQKQRYQAIRKALKEQELFEYADTSLDARREVFRHLLDANKLSFNSVQQAVNFIAIMLGKERIQDIIKAEINNVVSETYKVGNDKKGHNPR